ncbi:MAG: aminotransferase class I/II-fold pyridoxal phosphate-dependent enzyme [Pseudomonadota bacterium]
MRGYNHPKSGVLLYKVERHGRSVVYATDTPDDLDALYDGGAHGFTYSREGHANARTLAQMIDGMEGAADGVVVSSGMAAISVALMATCKAGDHVLGGNQLYGRSLRMMNEELPRLGMETSVFDPTDIAAARAAVRPNTRAILIEVVSNPTLRVADMPAIYALAREIGAVVIVDNTFTTPYAYRPFDHGADIVVHSVTKLMAGHSDAMLGYVAARDPGVAERLNIVATTWGFTASPFDCWMAERGLLSFDLRFERAQANARALAEALNALPGVARTVFPGLPNHPDHNRARDILGDAMGNMVSFEIPGGRAAANALTRAAQPIAFAPTLGDINTTLSHAASSSHRALSAEARGQLGMSEGFFRVSVGVEPAQDIIAAFTRGVEAAARADQA